MVAVERHAGALVLGLADAVDVREVDAVVEALRLQPDDQLSVLLLELDASAPVDVDRGEVGLEAQRPTVAVVVRRVAVRLGTRETGDSGREGGGDRQGQDDSAHDWLFP